MFHLPGTNFKLPGDDIISLRMYELKFKLQKRVSTTILSPKVYKLFWNEPNTYIFGWGTRHLYPRLREECAWPQHEDDINHHVDGILKYGTHGLGRRKKVTKASHWVRASRSSPTDILQNKDEKNKWST